MDNGQFLEISPLYLSFPSSSQFGPVLGTTALCNLPKAWKKYLLVTPPARGNQTIASHWHVAINRKMETLQALGKEHGVMYKLPQR